MPLKDGTKSANANKAAGKGRGAAAGPTARGGGRGGRGRGSGLSGFAGLGPSTLRNAAILGGLTSAQVVESITDQPDYPESYEPPVTDYATDLEYNAYKCDRRASDRLKRSPYYVKPPDASAPAYAVWSRKSVADRDAAPEHITDPRVKSDLNPDFFPKALWAIVFEPKARVKRKRKEARAKAKAKRSAAEIDIDKHVADAERTSKEDGATGDAPESGEEDLMTDSEEEDGNDYEGNYFDNGEEDSGGDDEAGDEGVMD